MTRARDVASAAPGTAGVPFRMASGTVTSTSSGDVTVTFPASRFTQTPLITASVQGGEMIVRIISSSSTGFSTNGYANFYGQVQVRFAGFPINYIAVQMTSGAASG